MAGIYTLYIVFLILLDGSVTLLSQVTSIDYLGYIFF